ncbi:hypothetical protein [Bradyrhizobium guangdongense]|uniref:hypothetical protein n=1 Tax=Bradyrhizobium guangdongense TaxID=1325090 RepID=UPI0010056F50|nr:hypothetical protein [Bradyrhizobium guangdongense]QAU41074.1 hypothetical protein X265_27895 [Bradyrhizobium guangdongense]
MKLAGLIKLIFAVMMSLITLAQLSATERDMTPVAYFMDQPPADVAAPTYLPSGAKDVIVAKVRLGQGLDVAWLGGVTVRAAQTIYLALASRSLKYWPVVRRSAKYLTFCSASEASIASILRFPARPISIVGNTSWRFISAKTESGALSHFKSPNLNTKNGALKGGPTSG